MSKTINIPEGLDIQFSGEHCLLKCSMLLYGIQRCFLFNQYLIAKGKNQLSRCPECIDRIKKRGLT